MFRRTKNEPTTADQVPLKPGGKGRPTPTRKDAEAAARARAKGSPASRRQLAAAERRERLLARDAGPVKQLVRDLVDSRLTMMELMLPLLVIVLVLGLTKTPWAVTFANAMLYAAFLTILVEGILLRFRVRREVSQRFPDESQRGLTLYAIGRAMQLRIARRPKPTVRLGQALPEHYR